MTYKRFIRYEEVFEKYDVDEELLDALIKASGAVFQLPRIRLVKLEEFDQYMKHFTTVGGSVDLIQRKFVRIKEGVLIYNIGKHRFVEMARAAGAVYKIGDAEGSQLLVRLDVFDEYMEQFRQEPVELKHSLRKENENGI